ncbi:MAG TPA: neutral/alkaline non-lysosomal ceramidase N-terminal domain-containing protein [Isosphaeraceae bacterium]|jgi:hypothetical protein|nr:neutral/alkaline non-lysosomal ceramidase N-terminal domain-containing protein [Isosphaeraceae bacterium]
MRMRCGFIVLIAGSLIVASAHAGQPQAEWQAGVARVEITPDGPVWMSGYAARKSPSEGVERPLFVKALALQSGDERPIVLVTADLIGFNRAFTGRVVERLKAKYALPRENVILFASHTHTGPMLIDSVDRMKAYGIDPEKAENNRRFTRELEEKVVSLVAEALTRLEPVTIAFGTGTASFAMNRREKTATGFKIGVNPDGPTDKSVPVLRVTTAAGKPLAIVFGYACHNTTLTEKFMKLSGDYAGFAQDLIEAANPGATALFVTGCAGDANPEPRGKVELALAHGRELADAVAAVLAKPLISLHGPIRAAYTEATLHFSGPPDRPSYEKRLQEPGTTRQGHAKRMIEAIDQGKPFRTEYPYPVQAFALGDQLTMVALGSEVVVDYALRLKSELGGETKPLWVAAYANDVFGYIPSLRVRNEGGYEGLEAFYGSLFPTPLADDVETRVVRAAREVVEKVRGR